jgi:hypothetical protein
MAYGEIKVDTVTFTDGGIDKSVSISGLVQNPTFSGNITVTGTISGNTVQGQTVSGATVTGNVGSFSTITGGTVTLTSGVFGTGTAAAPSIAFTGDSNTGIYSPGADQVAVATNGAGRLFVDAGGNVGVGLSPSYRLDVAGPFRFRSQGYLYDTAGTSQLMRFTEIGTRDARMDAFNGTDFNGTLRYAGANLLFETGTGAGVTERLRITSAGLVGIGTSTPSNKLHVSGDYIAVDNGYGLTTIGGLKYIADSDNNAPATGALHNFFTDNGTTSALVIQKNGNVGIGTTAPGTVLHCSATDAVLTLQGTRGTGASATIGTGGANSQNLLITAGTDLYYRGASQLFQNVAGTTEYGRWDSSGRLLVGTSTSVLNGSTSAGKLQVADTVSTAIVSAATWVNNPNGSLFVLGKSRSTTPGSYAIVSNNDLIGAVRFAADDGTDLNTRVAEIKAEVDGTPGADDMPGRLVFSTTSDGASSPTERLRIDSSGRVGIGTTSPSQLLEIKGVNAQLVVNGTTTTDSGIEFQNNGTSFSEIKLNTSAGILDISETQTSGVVSFSTGTGGTERARIDSSGRLLVGTSSGVASNTAEFQGNSFSSSGPANVYIKLGATNPASGNNIGAISFSDSAGSLAGLIQCASDGTWGTNDYPGRLVFSTTADGASSPTERMRITSSGNVGIGTTAPSQTLGVAGGVGIGNQLSTGTTGSIKLASSGGTNYIQSGQNTSNASAAPLVFTDYNAFNEWARIDSSGRLLVGTSSAIAIGGESSPKLQLIDASATSAGWFNLARFANSAGANAIQFGKSRGTTVGDYTIVQNNDALGSITFAGSDGTDLGSYGAQIKAEVDGTPGANDMPGRLVFSTTADGASSPTERLRITSAGRVGIGTSSPGAMLDIIPTGSTVPFRITSDDNGVIYKSSNAFNKRFQFFFQDNSGTQTARIGADLSGANASNLQFVAGSGATPQVTLNSSGQVGIGTTTVSSNLHIKPTTGDDSVFTNGLRVERNDTSGQYGLFNYAGGAASITAVETTASNPVVRFLRSTNGSTTTETARFDASGRLLVGTSTSLSSPYWSNLAKLQVTGEYGAGHFASFQAGASGAGLIFQKSRSATVGGNTIVNSGDNLMDIAIEGNDGTGFVRAAAIQCVVDGTPGANDMPGRLVFSTTADGASSPTERMRIDRNGNLLLGTASQVDAGLVSLAFDTGVHCAIATKPTNNAGYDAARFFNNSSGQVGSINCTTTSTAYNTSSDYRLKENVTPVSDGITRLQQLKPSRFNFIVDPDKTVDGFLAHEVQTIVPEAITGEKDAVDDEGNPEYQGIDQSKLVPLLTAALQEAIAKIETLEGMVAVNNITIDEQQHQLSTLAARLTALESA